MSTLSTHILDTANGTPAAQLPVTLYREVQTIESSAGADVRWQSIASGTSNGDGRIPDLLRKDARLDMGRYRMHFATGAYFARLEAPCFYPWVDVVFEVTVTGGHFHIPLLLSPFGYSTYRGS